MLRRYWLLSCLLLVSMNVFAAEEEPAPKDRAVLSPLTARLVAKKDTYTLPADQQGEAFRMKLKDVRNREIPMPPAVELMLEITNPTDKPFTITVGADSGALMLDLKGPGAVSISPLRAMTREFRLGKEVEIPAGKTYEMPITKLAYGMRGISNQAHWTEPGDYTLGATFRWPSGESVMKVVAEPIKLTVKAAE